MAVDQTILKRLAELFAPHARLYAVGGFCREKILGAQCHDLDVCSEIGVDDVKNILLNTEFVVCDRNLRMGTVIIAASGKKGAEGGFSAEYTTFRTDSYERESGRHSPERVEFTSDIVLDAKRRDFRSNAVYYCPIRDEFVDPLGGIEDIKKRILCAADEPDTVFEADGLRVLRMVRFAAELGFEVEEKTYLSAKKNAWRVKDISAERILAELERIFVADTAHIDLSTEFAHVRGIKMLDDLGLVDMILPELAALKGLAQPVKHHIYDAYVHSIECFKAAPARIRWAALLHDVGKRPCMEKDGNMYAHADVGSAIVRARLNALKMPKERISRICALIENHMIDLNGDMSENKLRWFLARNAGIAEDIGLLKQADGTASKGVPVPLPRMSIVFEEMKRDGTPLSIKELPVNGRDLIELGVKESERGKRMEELWREAVMNPVYRKREKALEYLSKKNGN